MSYSVAGAAACRWLSAPIVFTALTLLTGGPTDAQASLLGRVTAGDSTGIARVLISIPDLRRSTFSDESGEFRLLGLSDGWFIVRFQLLGFRPAEVEIELSGIQRVEVELERSPFRSEGLLASPAPACRRGRRPDEPPGGELPKWLGTAATGASQQFAGSTRRAFEGDATGPDRRGRGGIVWPLRGCASTESIDWKYRLEVQ